MEPYFDKMLIKLQKQENRKSSNVNDLADFYEFCCLASRSKYLAIGEMRDELSDENALDDATDEFYDIDELEGSKTIDNRDYFSRDSNAADSDIISAQVGKAAEMFAIRKQRFAEYYPFEYKKGILSFAQTPLSDKQQTYAALLVSSLLWMATRSGRNRIGHHFEEICGPIFNELLPQGTTVAFFGAGTELTQNCKTYSGKLKDKISTLASELNTETSHKFSRQIWDTNNGDGGLDWLAYSKFNDNEGHFPVYFAQCACGQNWADKQTDCDVGLWRNLIQFSVDPQLYHFVPRALRNTNWMFLNPVEVRHQIILLDRPRMIELVQQHETQLLPPFGVYQAVLREVAGLDLDAFD